MKGLTLHIYRSNLGDCSNGGISGRTNKVTMVGVEDGKGFTPVPKAAQVFEADDLAPAVVLVKRYLGSRPAFYVRPLQDEPDGHVGWMDGGTYVDGDSRFHDLTRIYGAVAFHDRSESEALYRSMSM